MIDTNLSTSLDETVLVFAPMGQDAKLAGLVLAKEGIHSESVYSLKDLCQRLDHPAAALLITEEALNTTAAAELSAKLKEQEAWSDLPIILLTSDKREFFRSSFSQSNFAMTGNVSLLERPFRTMTLITAVRVAIRARKRQYQVRDLLLDQQRSLRQRDEFLSIASHELKTPLTSLKLQVQMRKRFISRGDKSVYLPEKVNALIQTTEHQIERLSRLVDDMLDVSRIENGKLALHHEDCDLGELVEQVLQSFSANFQAVGSLVEFKADENALGHWDRYRIEQVVANLFTNVIKYAPAKPVYIEVLKQEKTVTLKIKDHGIGIAPEDQTKIFQRFERAVSPGNVSGLGLGLYITKQILEMHNGSVRVESEIGKGATFIVELPLVEIVEPYAGF